MPSQSLNYLRAILESSELSFCRLLFYPAKDQLVFTRAKSWMNTKQPVSFPGWKAALALSNLTQVVMASHTRQILTFLRHCKQTHSPATADWMKQWLVSGEPDPNGPAHLALRWFYREGRKPVARDRIGSTLVVNPPSPVVGLDARKALTTESPKTEIGGQEKSADREIVLGASRSASTRGSYNQRQPIRPMEPRPSPREWDRHSHVAGTYGAREYRDDADLSSLYAKTGAGGEKSVRSARAVAGTAGLVLPEEASESESKPPAKPGETLTRNGAVRRSGA